MILPALNETWTNSLWSLIIENSLKWTEEGWGSFIAANSALFVTPALDSSAAKESMAPLLEFGRALNESGIQGVQVISAEFPSWGAFFNTFAGTDSAVSVCCSGSCLTINPHTGNAGNWR